MDIPSIISIGTLIIASGLDAATSSIFTPPSEEATKTGPCNINNLNYKVKSADDGHYLFLYGS